jgi:hypothetical protein
MSYLSDSSNPWFRPSLRHNTANPGVIVNPVQTCGGIPSTNIPNNSFGCGRVDALGCRQLGGAEAHSGTTAASCAAAQTVIVGKADSR